MRCAGFIFNDEIQRVLCWGLTSIFGMYHHLLVILRGSNHRDFGAWKSISVVCFFHYELIVPRVSSLVLLVDGLQCRQKWSMLMSTVDCKIGPCRWSAPCIGGTLLQIQPKYFRPYYLVAIIEMKRGIDNGDYLDLTRFYVAGCFDYYYYYRNCNEPILYNPEKKFD